MKAKVLVPILLFILISVFAGNWIYGKMSAKKIDKYLQQIDYSEIEYSQVKVNPLMSKLTFYDFKYSVPDSELLIESKVLIVSMKHNEALEISKKGEVERITRLGLDFDEIKLYSDSKDPILIGENLIIDFKGDLCQDCLDDLDNEFPAEEQKFNLHLHDAIISNLEPNRKIPYTSVLNGFENIQDLNVQMVFDPNKKELNINKVLIDTDALEFEGGGKLVYKGNGLEHSKASLLSLKYESKLNEEFTWQDNNSSGKYKIKSFTSKFKGQIEFDEDGEIERLTPGTSLSINLKDLALEFDGDTKKKMEGQLSMIGIKPEELVVNEFKLNTKIDSENVKIQDTKLVLPVLQATLDANLKINEDNPDDSEIEQVELKISNIAPNVKKALTGFEGTFGFKIPWEGENIVLEMKGSMKKPQIKGIHY